MATRLERFVADAIHGVPQKTKRLGQWEYSNPGVGRVTFWHDYRKAAQVDRGGQHLVIYRNEANLLRYVMNAIGHEEFSQYVVEIL